MVVVLPRRQQSPPDAAPAPSELVPRPPSDQEKLLYIRRELPLLITTSVLSVTMLAISQVHFISLDKFLLVFLPFLIFTWAYFLISLIINLPSKSFDVAIHADIVARWTPAIYPSVDIFLPICNEQISVLYNTWTHVDRLARRYCGDVTVFVLDDGASSEAEAMASRFGFYYTVRPNRGWFKKAGNLRHGYAISSSEFIAIFDADFAPRDDFLDELLPYMDQFPNLGIVQSPQYFRVGRHQSLMARGAGAVQELFYRVVQVSRDRLEGAICVGSCAIYRRQALDDIGGTTLIGHSEDVHTGFDLARAGWGLRYVPILLATGLCPDDSDSFLVQQYRWCSGSMSLLGSGKFWQTKLRLSTRLCYISGFCYYLHTAVFTFVMPLIPITLMMLLPDQVHLRNYFWIAPSMIYNFLIFPLWNRARFGAEAYMARTLYGWAHVFAVWDIVRNKRMGWQPTGGAGKRNTDRIWRAVAWWGGATSAVWIGTAIARMVQIDALSFVFLLFSGLVYASLVTMALWSRRRPAPALERA